MDASNELVGIPCCGRRRRVWLCCWPVAGPALAATSLLLVAATFYLLYGSKGFSPSITWWVVYAYATVVTAFQDTNVVVSSVIGFLSFLTICTYVQVKIQMGYTVFTDLTLLLSIVEFAFLIASLGGAMYFRVSRSAIYYRDEARWKSVLKAVGVPMPLVISLDEAEEVVLYCC